MDMGLSMAGSILALCVKIHEQYELVKRYRTDCEKLHRLVLGVKKVLGTAAEDGADMTTKQWASALESLKETLAEVAEVFRACQRTGILASLFNGQELNMRLDRVNSRLMVALQLIPIQQHSASAQRMRHDIADLKRQVQTSQYAASREAAQKSEQLERMLQGMLDQHQQENSALQAQNRQLQQRLLQQQQAFMLQIAQLMQSGSFSQQQQPHASGSRMPLMPAAMDSQQLDTELADLQSCMQSAQPQQQQYLKQTIQFVQRLQQHQKTKTLHLAFGSLPGQQPSASQAPSFPTDSANSSSSHARNAPSAAGPSSVGRVNSSSSAGPSAPGRYSSLPTPVPVVGTVAPRAVRRAVSTVDRYYDADAQPSAPVLPGSVIWAGAGGVQGGGARRSSDPSGGSNRLQLPAHVVYDTGVDAGRRSSNDSRSHSAHSTGSSSSGSGTGRMQPGVVQPVILDTSADRQYSWIGSSNDRGSRNGYVYGQQSQSYSPGAGAGPTAAALPGGSSMPGAVNAAAVGGGSTADVTLGQQHWRSALAAAKTRPEAAEGWRLLGVALQGEKAINFSRQGLTDRDLEAVARYAAPFWSQVTSVDLSNNSITGLGMVPLAQYAAEHWRYLQHLNLSNNSIGADGAAVLARQAAQHWHNMQHLQLNGTAIGNAGAQALAEHAAPHWLGLMWLDLQQNGMSNRGAAALADPAVLQKWGHMQRLDLRYNSISTECAEILHMAAERMWERPGAILV